MSEDRAVSNVFGYVLLFSVILLSITTTFTFGLDAIEQGQDGTVQESSTQAMGTVGDRIETLRESNTTVRRSQIRTRRGTIGYGEQTRVTVSVDGTEQLQTTFRPLEYQFDGTTLAYEAGAIVRTNADGGTLVDDPPFVFDDDAVVLPIVSTEPETQRLISGAAVTVRLGRVASRQAYFGTGSDPVEIEIDTTAQRAAVWQRTLSERGGSCTEPTPGTVECEFTPSDADATIVVREFRVSYAFET